MNNGGLVISQDKTMKPALMCSIKTLSIKEHLLMVALLQVKGHSRTKHNNFVFPPQKC